MRSRCTRIAVLVFGIVGVWGSENRCGAQAAEGKADRAAEAPKPRTKAYYTIDDGTTWFVDSIDRVSPYQKDGKLAFRAHIHRCGEGKASCAWLEAFTPIAKKELDELLVDPARRERASERRKELEQTMRLVKRAGQPGWVPMRSPRAETVIRVVCPDSSLAEEMHPPE